MLRRAVVVAALSSVAILAVPVGAQAAGGWHGGGPGGGSHGSHGARTTSSSAPSTGQGEYVEVRWATPLSSGAASPKDGGDAALWPQHLATAATCGVWLQYDRYVPGSTTDRLVTGGVLYGPNNPTEVLATRYPYSDTKQPWTFVKAPDCGTTTPTPAPSHTPCPSGSPTPRVSPTPRATPSTTPTTTAPPVVPPVVPPATAPTPSQPPTPSDSPTPSTTPSTSPSTTPTTPAASPSSSVPVSETPSATPTPTTPDTEVLASEPTPTADGGIVRSTPPPAYRTQTPEVPDSEVLASTGSSGAGAVGIVAAVLAGAGALLVVARRRSAR